MSAVWGVCVLWAGWALQRTQHAKEMKTVPITQNFCSPRVIHSVCLLPLGVPHYAPERKAAFLFTPLSGESGCAPLQTALAPLRHLCTSVRGNHGRLPGV